MTTPSVTRKFHARPIVMLTAAIATCKNLESSLTDFKAYPHMTKEWIDVLNTDATQLLKAVGIKANEQQREATAKLNVLRSEITHDALIIKNQIERGFINQKQRCAEILNLLGFRANWTKATRGNQMALLELVLTFSNHADNLKTELVANRVSIEQIGTMKGYADMMNEANITQETLKNTTPVITADTNIALNKVYDRLMDVCSAGKIIYRKDPVKKALFSYRRLTSQQTPAANTKPSDTSN